MMIIMINHNINNNNNNNKHLLIRIKKSLTRTQNERRSYGPIPPLGFNKVIDCDSKI